MKVITYWQAIQFATTALSVWKMRKLQKRMKKSKLSRSSKERRVTGAQAPGNAGAGFRLRSQPREKEVILLAKSQAYFPIQSIGDIYHLIFTSVSYDRYYEAWEFLDSYIAKLKEEADYTKQKVKTDLESYEATLDEQRALLLDICRELEELERGDLTKSNLIKRIAELRETIYDNL